MLYTSPSRAYIRSSTKAISTRFNLCRTRHAHSSATDIDKIVILGGGGFIGPYIANTLLNTTPNRVQLATRTVHLPSTLASNSHRNLLPPTSADVTQPQTLEKALSSASSVINLVGIMHERPPQYTFDKVHVEGARNVAEIAKSVGAKLVHVSAIGADKESGVPYARTKGLGEEEVRKVYPDATIVRPSIVFGKEDDFFNRFAKLARILPFVPVFGGGHTKFQPVYVEDLAEAIAKCITTDQAKGKTVEAGGPEVYEYKDMMRLMLDQADIKRPIISLPWIVGTVQGFFLERLPLNLFTITRDQVELLKKDNVVSGKHMTLEDIGVKATPPERVLHTYLRRQGGGLLPKAPKNLSSPQSRTYSTTTHNPKPLIVETIADYRALRSEWTKNSETVGFVPTMGALHEGHLSLARLAKIHCTKVVASIFVNPAQFAPHEDLSKYPRTFPRDVDLLTQIGVDAIFFPSVKEMYPAGIVLDVSQQTGTFVEVKGKSHQMEGSIRPHFFRGVATIVMKLFNIIQPTKAFFGQKDAQQCAVVRSMVRDLFVPTEVVVGETVREEDGLAMSSRNRYLSTEERKVAPVLYRGLVAGQKAFERGFGKREELVRIAKEVIEKQEGCQLEYLSIANPFTLEEEKVVGDEGAIFSGAIRVGKTRIIDNVLLGISTEKWVE